MAHALRPKLDESKTAIDTLSSTAGSIPEHQTFQECVRRTIWAAFVVDCLLSGAKHRLQSFMAVGLDLSMPMGEEDFTFEIKPDDSPPHLLRLALSAP